MSRIGSLVTLPVLMALASAPAWAQQLQRPATPASPATQPATATPPPATVPANPAQRAYPAKPVPNAGPSTPHQVPVTQPMPAPKAPTQVRDAQGRIVPGAQEVAPGRARDPATGQEFQTAPATRPR